MEGKRPPGSVKATKPPPHKKKKNYHQKAILQKPQAGTRRRPRPQEAKEKKNRKKKGKGNRVVAKEEGKLATTVVTGAWPTPDLKKKNGGWLKSAKETAEKVEVTREPRGGGVSDRVWREKTTGWGLGKRLAGCRDQRGGFLSFWRGFGGVVWGKEKTGCKRGGVGSPDRGKEKPLLPRDLKTAGRTAIRRKKRNLGKCSCITM